MESETTGRLRWDLGQARTAHCDVASARESDGAIVLSFGERRDAPGGELETELLRQVEVDLTAARRLEQMLTRLVADREAT